MCRTVCAAEVRIQKEFMGLGGFHAVKCGKWHGCHFNLGLQHFMLFPRARGQFDVSCMHKFKLAVVLWARMFPFLSGLLLWLCGASMTASSAWCGPIFAAGSHQSKLEEAQTGALAPDCHPSWGDVGRRVLESKDLLHKRWSVVARARDGATTWLARSQERFPSLGGTG